MNIWLLLLILFLLGAFGSAPVWPHQGFGMGWGPSGILGVLVVVILILLVLGKL